MQKRLNKYISETGFCSRREADKLISDNKVKINGVIPELGTKVSDADIVTVNGMVVQPSRPDKSDRIYIAYNKPIGIICTTEKKVKGNIIDAINYPTRIFPIGRLDKPSQGLILLTSDGDIVNKILRAENAHKKYYRVVVDKPLTRRFIEGMSDGVPILGTLTKSCEVKAKGKFGFDIILTQGLNRQIRRMCEYFGYGVTQLTRKRIMHIDLKGLKIGEYRHLTQDEVDLMNDSLKASTQ